MKQKEKKLSKLVRRRLSALGLHWASTENSPHSAGFSDLVVMDARTGRMAFVELKTLEGHMSLQQEAFRDAAKAQGLEYVVWRSLGDCEEWVHDVAQKEPMVLDADLRGYAPSPKYSWEEAEPRTAVDAWAIRVVSRLDRGRPHRLEDILASEGIGLDDWQAVHRISSELKSGGWTGHFRGSKS